MSSYFIQSLIRNLLKVFWIFPIKKNRIVFWCSGGKFYNCNPKYISEYLQENFPDKYDIIWIIKDKNKRQKLKSKNIKSVFPKSISGIYYCITAKFLIDNHGVFSYIPVRKNQEVINTWHGGGSYKKTYSSQKQQKYLELMRRETTLYLSSCERFSKCNLSFVNNQSKILSSGLPRNDLFFKECPQIVRKVKDYFNLDYNKKIILYAPTYRETYAEDLDNLDINKIISVCNQRFGGEFIFALRIHQFDKNQLKNNTKNIIYTNSYDDAQELLYASDVLITDYSSCIWDASLMYKPCFIFASDLELYLKDRNFYTPISKWPFPIAESSNKLYDNILHFDFESYKNNVDAHHKELGSYESGNACEKVCGYIESKCNL